MTGFRSERPAPREHCVTLRVTEEQNETLDQLAVSLTNGKKGEVLRLALDYYLENSPEAKRALKRK